MSSPDGGDESDRVPLQGRVADERARSAPSCADQSKVFARAADAGSVWVSGLGMGAGSADVNVLDADWRGGPELARALLYTYLGTGRYAIHNARLARR